MIKSINKVMILIISTTKDGHAVEVLKRLEDKGANARLLDLSLFPQRSKLAIEFNQRDSQEHEIDMDGMGKVLLSEVKVIWWRRPQPFLLHPEINADEDRNFAHTECYSAFSGLWRSLEVFWINQPTLDDDAAKKVYQLKLAQQLGLRIPDTCITNSPQKAIEFVKRYGNENVIYKAFSGTEQAWRETRILRKDDFELVDNIKYAPVILQEYIPAQADLRITVIDKEIFACAIYTDHTSYQFDFRMVMEDALMEAYQLPEKVKKKLYRFMKQIGLVYGAIDMRLTPDDEFVFLEINPSGQWLFVEQRTGLPITDCFSDLLVAKNNE